MSRKSRVPYVLNPGPPLSREHLLLILRAADSIIARGGRTVLTQILKGSREKKLLEHGLDANPAYGSLRELSRDEVASIVDRAIVDGYLRIEYNKDLPFIVYTPEGWEIERATMVQELLADLHRRRDAGPPYDMTHLIDRNREMIMDLLDVIEQSAGSELIPLLEAWREIDYKKVRARIDRVIASLRSSESSTIR